MTSHQPLLFRLGRSAARHRGRFVATWLVVALLGFATSLGLLGNESLFDRLESGDIDAPGQAQTGRELLTETGDGGLTVILRVDGADLTDPDLTATVEKVVSRVERLDGVTRVDSPMTTPGWPRDPASLALVGDNGTSPPATPTDRSRTPWSPS